MAGIPCSLYAQDSFIITRGFLDADTERMGIHNLSDPGSPPVITGWGASVYASVSWDGSRKAYRTFNPSGFSISNIDDSDEQLVYTFSQGDRIPSSFSLSPDGNQIAYVTNCCSGGIYVIDVQEQSRRLIVPWGQVTGNLQWSSDYWPRWSSDGTKLVFQVPSFPTISLYMVDINGDQPPVRITFPEEDLPPGHENNQSLDLDFDWLPNSSRVLFRRQITQASETGSNYRSIIYEMDMNDESLTKKVIHDDDTSTQPLNSQIPIFPRWSPTGDQIAVRRVVSGVIGLYAMDSSGGGFTLLYQVPHVRGNYLISRIERWTSPLAEKEIQVNSSADRPNLAGRTNCDTGELIEIDGEDAPECTLRAAIELANARGGATITFDIPGGGVPRILVDDIGDGSDGRHGLPPLEQPITIDGTTQPGGWVEVSGPHEPFEDHWPVGESESRAGILIAAGGAGSTIRGLVINRFITANIHLLPGADGCTISGNRLGTDASGLHSQSSTGGLWWIPDPIEAQRERPRAGLIVSSSNNEVSSNLVSGNFTTIEENGGYVFGGGTNVLISQNAHNNIITGNHIGLDAHGNVMQTVSRNFDLIGGTGYVGMFILGSNTTVGGDLTSGNIIAGHDIDVQFAGYGESIISGNVIGLGDIDSHYDFIRGPGLMMRENGISTAGQTTISDNTVVRLSSAMRITIDNTVVVNNTLESRNLKRHNEVQGRYQYIAVVEIGGEDFEMPRNGISVEVSNNDISGDGWGIMIYPSSKGRIAQNTIRTSYGGVRIPEKDSFSTTHQAVVITRNSIVTDGIGIDLGGELYGALDPDTGFRLPDGVTMNDINDADDGPNELLNYPIFLQAVLQGVIVTVEGLIDTPLLASSPYRVEFFSSQSCSSEPFAQLGGFVHGPGEHYMGAIEVTPSFGKAHFMAALTGLPEGHIVLAMTSTVETRNITSEFSRCVYIAGANQVAIVDVAPGQSGPLLDDLGFYVNANTEARAKINNTGDEPTGRVYLTRYDTPPAINIFSEHEAKATDGSMILPETMAPRYWQLADRGLTEVGDASNAMGDFDVCLDPSDLVEQMYFGKVLIVRRNDGTGGVWEPLNTVEQEINDIQYLCANELNAFGDFGLGTADENLFTSLDDNGDTITQIPTNFVLGQNYPNPFNPGTVVPYDLPTAAYVRLTVYDMLGRRVSLLVDEFKPAGRYQVNFDGHNLSSGMYIYRLDTGDISLTRKMMLVK